MDVFWCVLLSFRWTKGNRLGRPDFFCDEGGPQITWVLLACLQDFSLAHLLGEQLVSLSDAQIRTFFLGFWRRRNGDHLRRQASRLLVVQGGYDDFAAVEADRVFHVRFSKPRTMSHRWCGCEWFFTELPFNQTHSLLSLTSDPEKVGSRLGSRNLRHAEAVCGHQAEVWD